MPWTDFAALAAPCSKKQPAIESCKGTTKQYEGLKSLPTSFEGLFEVSDGTTRVAISQAPTVCGPSQGSLTSIEFNNVPEPTP